MSESDTDRVQAARQLYRQGDCCAKAIVLAFLKDRPGIDAQALSSMASGLCGGMGEHRADCGALSGAALCLGPLLDERSAGRQDPETAVRRAAAQLNKLFDERFGGTRCEAVLSGKSFLARQKPFCEQVTAETAELLERVLKDAPGR